MDDYRGELCLLDGEYIARCISQDYNARELTFEVSPGGEQFIRRGEYGVKIISENGMRSFEDVKHLLPRIAKEE